MNIKIVGIIIIVLGLAGILGGAYFFYMQMFYVPSEEIATEDNQKNEENEDLTNQSNNNSLYNLPLKTEQGSTEKIIELQERKSVTISNKEEKPQDNRSLTEEQLKRTASLFVERFGSYSNQSNFSNISDLKIFMTDDMKRWADDFIKKSNIDRDVSVYYGIITKSISQRVEILDESVGEATIYVKTLRRESSASSTEDNSFYQEAYLKFIFEKGSWKVDKASWE